MQCLFFFYRLSYVRSITSHKTEVKVVAISDTLGDIASVSRHGKQFDFWNIFFFFFFEKNKKKKNKKNN